MKPLKVLLFALLMSCKLFAQENQDERWQYIGQSTSKEKYYIDVLSLAKLEDEFGVKEVWIKCIVPVKKVTKKGKTLTYYNAVILTLHEIKCSRNEMRVKQEVIYTAKGTLIDSWSNEFGDFKKVVPGTSGERVVDEACKIH